MQELLSHSNASVRIIAHAIATCESETASVEIINAAERLTLEDEWQEGDLDHHHKMVLAFAREQRVVILEFAGGSREPIALAGAVRRLIATLRTVHHASEMQAQMREIHNEIWYCGQRGDYDRRRIARDWVERHGETWRRWRIKEYLFVAERSAAEIASVIAAN